MNRTFAATALSLLFTTVSAHASAPVLVAQWSGDGAVLTTDGEVKSTYHNETEIYDLGAGATRSVTKITLADGSVRQSEQTITHDSETSFRIEGSYGKGGGACYGEGLCESYMEDGKGTAIAVTIVKDGDQARRDLIVVMKDGKAQQMLREKLIRVK